MSVLVHLSIFPLDRGAHVSDFVARAVAVIRESGLDYSLGSMGTTLEGEWAEVMAVVTRCFEVLQPDCTRIIMNMTTDYRQGERGRIRSKIKSVEAKLLGKAGGSTSERGGLPRS